MEEIEGLGFKKKKAAAFGSYGWSGEGVARLNGILERSGFGLINQGIKCLWNPDEENLAKCRAYGGEIAKA
jgi:flavorubredoxin